METVDKSIIEYLEEYAQIEPDKLFLYSEQWGYTVKDTRDVVYAIACFFGKKGIRNGEYVALAGLRTQEAVVVFLALRLIGAVVILCDPHEKIEDYVANTGVEIKIDHYVDHNATSWTLDGEEFAISARTLNGENYAIRTRSVDGNELIIKTNFADEDNSDANTEKSSDIELLICCDTKAPAVIIFTSGSTGVHKGVILSEFNLVNHMRNFHSVGGNEEGDRAIQMLPIFHIFGLTQIIDGIMHRCPLFFPKEVTPDYICECIEKYGFTRFGFVPSFALAMADAKKRNGYNTDSLKVAVLAGAYSTRQQFEYIQDTLGMRIVPVYGMSECPGITGAAPDEPADKRASTVGKVLPMNEVRIEDDGEITVKGPALFMGYVGEERGDQNEFFRTGDLGFIDGDGFLHITGRKKEIIIRNGNNLSVHELEKKLMSLGFVANAAVVGIPSRKCGEVPAAMITIKHGSIFHEGALSAIFNKLEMPEVIRVVDSLPTGASGKVDKLKIKEMLS